MNNNGILIVFSGFSGSGKGTIMKELMSRYSDNYGLSISATTRKPRYCEQDGREYFFKTRTEFETMIENKELVEYAEYVGNYYGTPCAYVQEQLALGKDVILEIETQGGHKVKEKFPDTLLLFVTPPTAKELHDRLTARQTETADVIQGRIKQAIRECDSIGDYDYLIVNDCLNEAVELVHEIISTEHYRIARNAHKINVLKTELELFSEGE